MATIAQCSQHLFVSMTRLRDLVGAGIIEHRPNGQYDLDKVREQYIRNLQKVASNRGGESSSLSQQRERLTSAKVEAVELRNAVAKGDFVSLTLFSTKLETLFGVLRETALGLAGKISDTLSAHCEEDRAQIYDIVSQEVNEMLTAMAVADVTSTSSTRQAGRRRRTGAERVPT